MYNDDGIFETDEFKTVFIPSNSENTVDSDKDADEDVLQEGESIANLLSTSLPISIPAGFKSRGEWLPTTVEDAQRDESEQVSRTFASRTFYDHSMAPKPP